MKKVITLIKNHLRGFIALMLIILAVISFAVALVPCMPNVGRDLSINMSATFIGMLVAVFAIDNLIQQTERQKETRARDHAAARITLLAIAIFGGFWSSFRGRWPNLVTNATQKMLDADQTLGTHTAQAQALKLMSGCAERSLAAAQLADWKAFKIDVNRWRRECNSLLSRWYAGYLDSEVLVLLEHVEDSLRAMDRSIEMAASGINDASVGAPVYCSAVLLACTAELLDKMTQTKLESS